MTPRDILAVASGGAILAVMLATGWFNRGRKAERDRLEFLAVVDAGLKVRDRQLDDELEADPEPA